MVIELELCWQINFFHADKYTLGPESVLEKKTHKIKKRTCHLVDFNVPADYKVKVKNK